MAVMTENKFVPKLRFGNFDGEWELKTINDVCKLKAGKFVSASKISKEQEGGLFSCYGGNGLRGFTRTYTHEGSYSLIGRQGALCGNVKFVIGKFHATEHAIVVTPTNINNSHWLYYQFCRLNLNRYATGQAQPGLSVNVIEKVKASFPSLPEQQKIASFLSAVDKKLQQLTKKKELLEEYKKGVMQKIFSQELRFKDEFNNNYPDWEEKKLGEELEHKSIRNKSNQVDLVLSVSNKKGFISQQEQFDGHQVASKDVTNYKVVNKGEYAYNPSRINVGSIARLDDFEKGIVSPMYVIFRLKNNLNPIFFDALYSSHRFKYLIKIGCSGSVRDSLNFDEMENFDVKLPCIEEQQKIANFLSSIDKKIELVSTQIEKTKAFKKGLLQQMFV